MSEIAAAGAAVTGLRAAFDLTKTFLDVQGAVKIQAKVFELQSHILTAQESAMTARDAQSALLDRIKELETEVAGLKKWNANKDDYRFEDVGSGAFVYSPKAEPTATQHNEWLCVTCFDGGHRGVLMNQGLTADKQHTRFACPVCKNGFMVHSRRGPNNRGEMLSDGTLRPS